MTQNNDQWEPEASAGVDPSRLFGRTSVSTSWWPWILRTAVVVGIGGALFAWLR